MSQEAYAQAMLGRDAEEFAESDIGKYLIGCAEQEKALALDQLSRVHPWRTRRIRELQNQVWRAESFSAWLGELVISGRQALQALEQDE